MRDGMKMMVAGVVGAIVLASPAVVVQKLHDARTVGGAVIQETGGLANDGMGAIQNVGSPTTTADPTTATTAPPVASGRP